MSEENLNNETQPGTAPADSTTQVTPAETAPQAAPQDTPAEPPVSEEPQEPAPAAPNNDEPQVIIQQERGFAHYVGFALLCVLCIFFYFMPGIALTFGVSRLVSLNGAAAWIFSAILSFVIWLIFKLKIKGFKKSFYFYIGLCAVVLAILVAIEVLTENYNVFSNIFALMTGAAG